MRVSFVPKACGAGEDRVEGLAVLMPVQSAMVCKYYGRCLDQRAGLEGSLAFGSVMRSGHGMMKHPSLGRANDILESAHDPALRDLVRYWMKIHPGHHLPGRRDFDPLDIPKVLRHLVLTEVERDPFRFKIRLMGTGMVEAFGNDFTGSYLDEVFENFHQTYGCINRTETAKTGLPTYRHGKATMPFRLDFAPIETVHLPLAADGRQVDMIVSLTVHMARDVPSAEKQAR